MLTTGVDAASLFCRDQHYDIKDKHYNVGHQHYNIKDKYYNIGH
ncbi:hypothetical protein [aff. Roholtiella sp. LEGE 12411]